MQLKPVKLSFSNRPAKSSTANRKAKTYSVTDNKVTGLENPLKFFPSKKYEFTVTEAGMSGEAPYVVGDERYAFLYWSTSSSGKNPQAKKVIMSSKGIPDANTYKMYLFFQKYRFNGTDWVKKGSPESISTEFSSAGYTDEELKEYLEEAKENGTEIPGYENGSGSGDDADAELTATAAASEKDAVSKSKLRYLQPMNHRSEQCLHWQHSPYWQADISLFANVKKKNSNLTLIKYKKI